MSTSPQGAGSDSSEQPTKEKLTKVPLWVPVSAFVGTSLVLGAIPLLLLRKRGPARMSLKNSVSPPPRNANAGARLPQPSAASMSTASTSEPVVTSLREELEAPGAGEMMSAMSHMNMSSGLMALKAFGIATALVMASAGGLVWTIRTTMDVHDAREFGHKMRSFMWRSLPTLTSRLRPEPEASEQQAEHVVYTPLMLDEKEWTPEEAQRRVERAYAKGGITLWAQALLHEAEMEERVARAKREEFPNA